ncbi:MAG: (2Fe-2S)-binding protein [Halieaceae bacterium]|jgi:isoquinoline 1-oxidoreductase alpha subunit|nr:(2Fe-2S)-binding protein [Halieaceae bacterium]
MKRINVNGKTVEVDADEGTPLLWVIREQLGMPGTKFGCGIAQCGACTIHIDGKSQRSCVYPLSAVTENNKIITIEGLSENGDHPVQQAWAELDTPQCGYCQPGMIMAVAGMLNDTPNPTDAQIDEQITNICRCGTFQRVRKGIHLAARKS